MEIFPKTLTVVISFIQLEARIPSLWVRNHLESRAQTEIMSFSVNPSFSFGLNRILVGSVKFGKYDGIHVCLTAVTSTDKVILHNPYKKLSETNNRLSWMEVSSDIAVLNFNQEIRAIETGCLSNDPKDILVIGSPTQLLGTFHSFISSK